MNHQTVSTWMPPRAGLAWAADMEEIQRVRQLALENPDLEPLRKQPPFAPDEAFHRASQQPIL